MSEKQCGSCKYYWKSDDELVNILNNQLEKIKIYDKELMACYDILTTTMTEYYMEELYDEYAIKKEDTIIAVIDSGSNARRICKLLNEQEAIIQDLKTRNQRQYELLKEIFDFMYARDWKALEQIVEEWEETDRLLQAEFKCCNGGDFE